MSELITKTGVPHWLQPPKKDTSDFYPEWIWETTLERLSEGEALSSICRDPAFPAYGRFLRWIHKDAERKARYREAQELATEVIQERALLEAQGIDKDGNPTMNDVQRSALIVKQCNFLASAWNRERYGERKQVEQTVTIDISDAMAKAQARIEHREEKVIEGEIDGR